MGKKILSLALVLLLFCTGLLIPGQVLAQPETTGLQQPGTTGLQQPMELPSMAGLFFRIIVSIVLILFLTYLVLNLVKRQHDLQQKQKEWVKIYDYQALGGNRGIYIMELLGKTCLVGVSDGQINILRELASDDPEWLGLKESLNEQPLTPPGMKNLLDNLKRFKFTGQAPGSTFQHQLADQLQRSHRLTRQITKGGKEGE